MMKKRWKRGGEDPGGGRGRCGPEDRDAESGGQCEGI